MMLIRDLTFHINEILWKIMYKTYGEFSTSDITDAGRVANSRIPIIRIYLNFENSQLLNRLSDFAQIFTVKPLLLSFIY